MRTALKRKFLSRPTAFLLMAILPLLITLLIATFFGLSSNEQFRRMEGNWSEYSETAGRKGMLISAIRGQLGYGGIIHNFKNYVLRQDPDYLAATRAQIAQFDATVAAFRSLDLAPEELQALTTIEQTIRKYEAMLPIAMDAAEQGQPPDRTDRRVRVDDGPAIAALAALETYWFDLETRSADRIGGTLAEGQALVRMGLVMVLAMALAAVVIGWLVLSLIRNLRGAVDELEVELTERRKLERSESRLATVVEQAPTTIFMTDTDARIVYVNATFEKLTGWSAEEVIGRTPSFLQSGETPRSVYREIRQKLASGERWSGVFLNRKKDGSTHWVDTMILPLVESDGSIRHYVGMGADITEERKAREQLVRAQKLEAVGQLAGGVAHDFNNILTTIVGASHLAALDAPEGSELAEEIRQIDVAARRAQLLVRELLAFARREPTRTANVDLGGVVDEVTGLLRASIPPTVRIETAIEDENILVRGDATHLHQILMNLCRNAAEALAGKPGSIRIGVERVAGDDDGEPARVRLSVSDDGPGIPPEIRDRLFEPFYTTKPIGKGSGLGLAVVHGLVSDMGGSVSVESTPGKGAVFSVLLNSTEAAAAVEAEEAGGLPSGTERVLLVDDEADVAGVIRRVLLRLGYRVEAYTSPRTALSRFRRSPMSYDILISDVVMPEIGGEEFVSEIRGIRDIPTILCSGYAPKELAVPGTPPAALRKPVDPAALAQTVRDLLDGKAAASAAE